MTWHKVLIKLVAQSLLINAVSSWILEFFLVLVIDYKRPEDKFDFQCGFNLM